MCNKPFSEIVLQSFPKFISKWTSADRKIWPKSAIPPLWMKIFEKSFCLQVPLMKGYNCAKFGEISLSQSKDIRVLRFV